MRILHYTLGLPPQRSGGLTKYATDLMCEEAKVAEVSLLYPAGYRWWSRSIYYREGVAFKGVATYELANTLPIPLLFGVKSPADLFGSRAMSERVMEELYNRIKPDIFHIHTLMGLPIELLRHFKERGVKLIYTSHDYFGICVRVNLIDCDGELCSAPSAERCSRCNRDSKSTLYMRLRNSRVALRIKNNPLVRKIMR